MIYWQLFVAFFVPNIVGYGGGPAIIPLIENEVVGRYGWMSAQTFAETLALGNALPSPIATKMAGYIGYDVAGVAGALVALFATVAPSLLLMLVALGTLYRYRDSIKVKSMSQWVRPVVMVLMAFLTWRFLAEGLETAGVLHTAIIGGVAGILLLATRVHPAFVVCFGLGYGALLLG
ncbi:MULTISPECIES: chromate transporter [Modicisalibacter]|uniref:chromate transporter n=1 Tax=Modicisalibacter TaxID=574347 RepID=UPI00100B4D62|nr:MULTISPECIES: chromate transporter [Halomonadaceae]MBZ9557871.1 chromate transporter [Modicisalibacter sp. R2A 31.J]MBZ9573463.1 chromate transporter [Modicisalibacter sp. MOD 31.J]